ncbi:MAG: alkaline phosphatase [Bacteroidia bacterium]|nr:alkaline phosphatase [Bacteroidia bacterium]
MTALLLLIFFLSGCQQVPAQNKRPKNVILMIGDGMGLSQVSSRYYNSDLSEPNFSRFKTIGLINTSSANAKITDSAAGATAFATGTRSYNGSISVGFDQQPLETIIERVERKGVKSGLVATSSITHATPACFFAHAPTRLMEYNIATQLPTSGVDFFAAGGRLYFHKRPDQLNLFDQLKQNGFTIDTTALPQPGSLKTGHKYGFIMADVGLPPKKMGRDDFLTRASVLACSTLVKEEGGFFLMIEGSQIDWECHASNVAGTFLEVRDFDDAIGAVLDFAEKDGNTLVIVTADHETGGFSLNPQVSLGVPQYDSIAGGFYEGSQTTLLASHTAALVPVFAFGPGSEQFGGIYNNTDIFHKVVKLMEW